MKLAIVSHQYMVQYKFSSQFTDLVTKRSKTPQDVLAEVANAVESLGDMGNITDNTSSFARAFHETIPSISDEDIMNTISGTPKEKALFVNELYGLLDRVRSITGSPLSDRARKYIELFLNGMVSRNGKKVGPVFKPIKVPGGVGGQPGPAGVIRGRQRKPEQSVGPVVAPPSASPRFERDEDMMISRLDRKREFESKKKSMNAMDLFVKVGILEKVPSLNERMVRMDLRKKAWTKMLAVAYGV